MICRLPFPVPTDPVIKARSETFNDAFNEYHTPMAIIRFRQGCGRLIRNRHSKGSIVVLDSRIRNKNYGMKFFHSLPKSTTAKAFMHNVGKIAKKVDQIPEHSTKEPPADLSSQGPATRHALPA